MHIGSVHVAWPLISVLAIISMIVLLVLWCRSKPRKWLDLRLVAMAGLAALLGGLQISPMASDEEMIAYFHEHRGELETLVKRYREYTAPPGKHWTWAEVPETRSLMQEIGVRELTDVAGGIWLPDPYSRPTSQRIQFSKGNASDEMAKYSAIKIRLEGDNHYGYWSGYGVAMKHLVYYPEVPKVEDDWLMLPPDAEFQLKRKRKYEKVVGSLDSPVSPREWGPMSCLLRRVESNWFISLCVGNAG